MELGYCGIFNTHNSDDAALCCRGIFTMHNNDDIEPCCLRLFNTRNPCCRGFFNTRNHYCRDFFFRCNLTIYRSYFLCDFGINGSSLSYSPWNHSSSLALSHALYCNRGLRQFKSGSSEELSFERLLLLFQALLYIFVIIRLNCGEKK